jgi:hypothetical protein
MKALWVSLIVLLAVGLSGCSAMIPLGQAAISTAPELGVPTGTTSGSAPLVVTVRPPSIYLGPGTPPANSAPTPLPNLPQGWQTFTSPSLGVSLEYPADWFVDQQANGITFRSPQGMTIFLQLDSVNNDQMTDKNQDCTTLINTYGLSSKVCVDASAATYGASFDLMGTDGTIRRIVLSTQDKQALDVYQGMLNSLRLSK